MITRLRSTLQPRKTRERARKPPGRPRQRKPTCNRQTHAGNLSMAKTRGHRQKYTKIWPRQLLPWRCRAEEEGGGEGIRRGRTPWRPNRRTLAPPSPRRPPRPALAPGEVQRGADLDPGAAISGRGGGRRAPPQGRTNGGQPEGPGEGRERGETARSGPIAQGREGGQRKNSQFDPQ